MSPNKTETNSRKKNEMAIECFLKEESAPEVILAAISALEDVFVMLQNLSNNVPRTLLIQSYAQ